MGGETSFLQTGKYPVIMYKP